MITTVSRQRYGKGLWNWLVINSNNNRTLPLCTHSCRFETTDRDNKNTNNESSTDRAAAVLTPTKRRSTTHDDFLTGESASYVDEILALWKKDPKSVHISWHKYFNNVESGRHSTESFAAVSPAVPQYLSDCRGISTNSKTAIRIIPMVRAFQIRGHLYANTDPLGLPKTLPYVTNAKYKELQKAPPESLDYKYFGFSENDLDRPAEVVLPQTSGFLGTWSLTPEERLEQWQGNFVATLPRNEEAESVSWTIGSLYERLRETYCGPIGVEYMHISDIEKCNFIRKMMESPVAYSYSNEMKRKILYRTAKARLFETFIGQKFATVKRFGLDGCETMVVCMKAMTKLATLKGIESVVIGMPHRGRLNVLTNVMQKPFNQVMSEFQGVTGFGGHDWGNVGDVKYHLGVEFEYVDPDNGKRMLMSVLPNPSHLEAVTPVVCGHARARQLLRNDVEGSKVLPIIVHGDAAFAGQGVVYETLQMSDVPAYKTGGAIHIVVNNQIGFTTDVQDQGSGIYCTDIGKAINAPIFHVNADDPEAVTYVSEMALKFRQKFHSDVFIDLVGYRRLGHNELDMPKFTQPLMYDKVGSHPHVLDTYSKKLIEEKVFDANELDELKKKVMAQYEEQFKKSKTYKPNKSLRPFSPQWKDMATAERVCAPRLTGVPEAALKDIGTFISTIPPHIQAHPTIQRVYKTRLQAIEKGEGIDFGLAEALAFGTLLREGLYIRMSGQDTQRGTFSHRHSIIHDQVQPELKYFPLQELVKQRNYSTGIEINNSTLSEYAALGFEYGFSLEHPSLLTIWEAQFGDFSNGAQIITDQFFTAGEVKWNAQTGLVLLLPHGYDGQGSEHSSGRIERFLQLADDREDVIHPQFWDVAVRSVIQKHNIQVVNCSTPANLFHVIRRQLHRGFRKPLVIFNSKKLLRMKEALSPLSEFSDGTRFARYIFDPIFETPPTPRSGEVGTGVGEVDTAHRHRGFRKTVKRLVLCSGQVYYDLVQRRAALKLEDKIMISRVEQLSPFPLDQLVNDIESLPNLEDIVWCQEEPMNQGSWTYVHPRIRGALKHLNSPNQIRTVIYCGRDVSASPAVGCPKLHITELERLLSDAMDVTRRSNSYLEKYSRNADA